MNATFKSEFARNLDEARVTLARMRILALSDFHVIGESHKSIQESRALMRSISDDQTRC